MRKGPAARTSRRGGPAAGDSRAAGRRATRTPTSSTDIELLVGGQPPPLTTAPAGTEHSSPFEINCCSGSCFRFPLPGGRARRRLSRSLDSPAGNPEGPREAASVSSAASRAHARTRHGTSPTTRAAAVTALAVDREQVFREAGRTADRCRSGSSDSEHRAPPGGRLHRPLFSLLRAHAYS